MRNVEHRMVRSLLGALLPGLLVVGSCGNSSTGPDGGGVPTAQFIDSPVEGLEYTVGALSGTTDYNGRFELVQGADVTFMVGGIVIGTAPVEAVLTPLQLVPRAVDVSEPQVTNIARFLQTIDDDAIPTNGIKITEVIRTAAAGRSINFDQSTVNFETDPDVQSAVAAMTAVSAAGSRVLVDPAAAQGNLASAIEALLPGRYSGIYQPFGSSANGPQIGTWSFSIDAQGNVAGSGTIQGQSVDWTGHTGAGSTISDSVPNSPTSYYGTITPSGVASGQWYGPGDLMAQFVGQRN